MSKVVIIGGGAAGMMAAVSAAQNGHGVLILEKNAKFGRKLYITGKGRCNLTNAAPVETMLENIPGNRYFLYSALYALDSAATVALFEDMGLKTRTERGNRVFPASDKASDVVRALERRLNKLGVKAEYNTPAKALVRENGAVAGVTASDGRAFPADAVIIATGGLSYPATGSTGDGYALAKSAGHTVTKLYPSLVPLKAAEGFIPLLEGLSLRNVAVRAFAGGKERYSGFGEMLFTRDGVSGPLILTASRHLAGLYGLAPSLSIDLKPALSFEELDARILRDFEKNINRAFKNSLDELLPQKLIPVIVELSGINPMKQPNSVTRDERRRLASLLKNLTLTITGSGGYDEAVITRGGVDVNEIDPSTMQSRLARGLYFAGEVLDLDALTGGFNLQIAFSTGWLAGSSIK